MKKPMLTLDIDSEEDNQNAHEYPLEILDNPLVEPLPYKDITSLNSSSQVDSSLQNISQASFMQDKSFVNDRSIVQDKSLDTSALNTSHLPVNKSSMQLSRNLVLDDDSPKHQEQDEQLFSYEFDTMGIKLPQQDYQIGADGMRSMNTGEIIVGSLLKNDLELGKILGNGASGYVYQALHVPTGRQVALKSINVHDKHKRHQMVNDLRALADNECPFLVQFHGAMFDEGAVKVALELMDMGSLKDLIKLAQQQPSYKKGQPLIPEPMLAKITQQILSGLSYLNVCMRQMHRDIKPDNILVNSKGFVKLTDFGIGKQMDSEEFLAGTFVGTMNYMSPERMEGEKYHYEGDIWSLGIVLIELATGSYPFKEVPQFLEMLEQIKYEDSPTLPKGIFSDELINFVDQCLQKERCERQPAIQLLAHPWLHKPGNCSKIANLPKYFKRLQSNQEQQRGSINNRK